MSQCETHHKTHTFLLLCAMVVSHDRYFLDRIATHILAFEGDSKQLFFEGNYADYEENRVQRLGETSIKRIKYAPLVNA